MTSEDAATTDERDSVQAYYGQTLTSSADLRTDACTTEAAPPKYIRQALAAVHDEVAARYYGCGLVLPTQLNGLNILDLGCGAGRDVFALAKLAGPQGRVTGVDMTPEQLAIAQRHQTWHTEQFGFPQATTRFVQGRLEQLGELGLEPGSFDLIVSNCVINLCRDKAAVFAAAHALLKPGGEMYFSDVYTDRRLPDALIDDPVLHGECLSGALYWCDFQQLAKANGFLDPRVVEHRRLAILDEAIEAKLAPAKFASVTVRMMKLDQLEAACEDYGQAVIYRGGIAGMERVFVLDDEHQIEAGRIFPVCGNTLAMLTETRFAPYFQVVGDGLTHYGAFPGCQAPDIFGASEGAQVAPVGGCC